MLRVLSLNPRQHNLVTLKRLVVSVSTEELVVSVSTEGTEELAHPSKEREEREGGERARREREEREGGARYEYRGGSM